MFETILGNEKNKQILQKSIQNNTISHSYMFVGIQGIGKKIIAKEFAKNILCLNQENKNGNTNCTCKSCIEFETNNNPDFSIIEPDGNSIKIEQIRELQKRIQEKPIISNSKVYIIDNADMMTQEAQNCLLKTLEEPPEYATIILIGSNENLFLTTIKSRCMILHFEPISKKKKKKYLQNELEISNIDDEMLDIFQGSIGKAIALKDKKEEYEKIIAFVENLDKKDIIDLYKLAEPIYKSKEEIFEILDYINILLLKKARQNYLYTDCIQIVEDTKKRLKQNGNYDMCIDNLVFNLKERV